MKFRKPSTFDVVSAVALGVTFLTPIIGAGHGAAPIGLFLIFGESAWQYAMLLGWTAYLFTVAGMLCTGALRLFIGILSLMAFAASFAIFLRDGERPNATIGTSFAFFAAYLIRFLYLIFSRNNDRTPPGFPVINKNET
jgi:hypothetical protein